MATAEGSSILEQSYARGVDQSKLKLLDSFEQDTPHKMFGVEVGSTSLVRCDRSPPKLRRHSLAQSDIRTVRARFGYCQNFTSRCVGLKDERGENDVAKCNMILYHEAKRAWSRS